MKNPQRATIRLTRNNDKGSRITIHKSRATSLAVTRKGNNLFAMNAVPLIKNAVKNDKQRRAAIPRITVPAVLIAFTMLPLSWREACRPRPLRPSMISGKRLPALDKKRDPNLSPILLQQRAARPFSQMAHLIESSYLSVHRLLAGKNCSPTH